MVGQAGCLGSMFKPGHWAGPPMCQGAGRAPQTGSTTSQALHPPLFGQGCRLCPWQDGATGGLCNWAGLLAGLCNCSWSSRISGCGLQLYVASGQTPCLDRATGVASWSTGCARGSDGATGCAPKLAGPQTGCVPQLDGAREELHSQMGSLSRLPGWVRPQVVHRDRVG